MFETIEQCALTLTVGPGTKGRYRAAVTRERAPWEQVMAQGSRILLATAEADRAEEAVKLVIQESQKKMEGLKNEQK